MIDFKIILSASHPFVKTLCGIREDKKIRIQEKKILITSEKEIYENAAFGLETLWIDKEEEKKIVLPSKWKGEVILTSKEILKKISGIQAPQKMVGVFKKPEIALKKGLSFGLVLDRIQDPGNMGTLLRTALAFNFDAVFILEGSADPFGDKVLRASKGALFHLPLWEGPLDQFLNYVEKNNASLVSASLEGKPLEEASFTTPLLVVLGNEGKGITPLILNQSTLINIPMQGPMESLNVALSGGIFLYEISKKRVSL